MKVFCLYFLFTALAVFCVFFTTPRSMSRRLSEPDSEMVSPPNIAVALGIGLTNSAPRNNSFPVFAESAAGRAWYGMEDNFSAFHSDNFLPFHILFHIKIFFHIQLHTKISLDRKLRVIFIIFSYRLSIPLQVAAREGKQ